jgi:hypothetical protein
VGESQTKAHHAAFRHIYDIRASGELPILGTTDAQTRRVWPSVAVTHVHTGSEEYYRQSNLTVDEDIDLCTLQTAREDKFFGLAAIAYGRERQERVDFRVMELHWASD